MVQVEKHRGRRMRSTLADAASLKFERAACSGFGPDRPYGTICGKVTLAIGPTIGQTARIAGAWPIQKFLYRAGSRWAERRKDASN